MDIGTSLDKYDLIVDGIAQVVPVRYDGMQERFVVCEPIDAQAHAIMTQSDEVIIISQGCENKELLLDII